MKEKSEAGQLAINFNTMIHTQFQSKIQVRKADNAKEYFETILGNYLEIGNNSSKYMRRYPTTKWDCRKEK